jgi:hypothetical protein
MLDPTRPHWVPAVIAPERDWSGAPGCRRGARFLIGGDACQPGCADVPTFATRAECLRWIMAHRSALAQGAPHAVVFPADLAKWLLGLA